MSETGRYRRKTWTERMNTGRIQEWRIAETQVGDVPAGSRMLISTPVMVDAAIRRIPRGIFFSISELREAVATEYEAAYVCPISFGLNLRIVAESAYEQYIKGVPVANVTPVWRVIPATAPLARRCSFPPSFLRNHRREEGGME
jgi:hypothetical protein